MEHSLIEDIKKCDWICKKIQSSKSYAQNMYAAFCNNSFQKLEVWTLLVGQDTWACSWRTAGGYIADIRGEGDYMDWYCSGMTRKLSTDSTSLDFVPEMVVTDEIREDLRKLGWIVVVTED